jgi:hypothetical protein
MPEWKLILRMGFGEVLPHGRWDFDGATLIAEAYNTGDWSLVEEYASLLSWDDASSN